MIVLHVIPGLSAAQGGLQGALLNLCRAQQASGITPVIAALHEDSPPDAAFSAFETHLFDCTFRPTGASRDMKDWLRLHADKYQAVIAHSLWRDPLLYAAEAASPLIVVAHGMLDPEALGHRAWRKLWRLRMKLPDVLRRATVVYTCAAEQQRSHTGPGGSAKTSAVIPLCVDVPAAPPDQSPDGPIMVLGRIHPRKGTLEWVRALCLMAQQGTGFTAMHAGPAEDRAYARSVYAAAEPLQGKLIFKGALPYSQAQALLARARIVVAPCAVRENFGMVIAEAMANARPVVAGRRGLIVPELEAAGAVTGADHEPQAYAAAMRAVFAHPERTAMRGHNFASRHYALPVVGASWRGLLGTVG